MNDMDDRKMKQQEFQAKMAAMQTQTQRDALNQKIELYKNNISQGDDGSIQSTPLRPQQQEDQDLAGKEKGINTTRDDQGHRTFSYAPDSPQMVGAKAKEYGAEHRYDVKPPKEGDWQKFDESLNPNKARGGNLAKTQAMINTTDRIKALFDQFPDGNIPKTQAVELGTSVAGLLSGGSPQSQQQIHDIVPSTMLGNAADIGQWFTGNPTGREQQQLMHMLKETTGRERDTAKKQLLEAQRAGLPAWEALRASNPDRFGRILKARGVTEFDDPNAIQPQAQQQQPAPGLVPQQQGFLGRLAGLLGGAPAQASAPAPAPHPQDAQAVQAAKQILADPNSSADQKQKAQIALKMNGL